MKAAESFLAQGKMSIGGDVFKSVSRGRRVGPTLRSAKNHLVKPPYFPVGAHNGYVLTLPLVCADCP